MIPVRPAEEPADFDASVRQPGDARAEYAEEYWKGQIQFDYLARRAPFVARELQRQGRLVGGDR